MRIFKSLASALADWIPRSRFFWGLLCLALAMRLALVWMLPFGQTVRYGLEGLNDEPSHYNYVKYLALNRHFPVQTESSKSPHAFEHNVFEYYQPPLYYIAAASFFPALGERATLYAGRLLSWLFGALTLFALGAILARVCRDKIVVAAGVLVCAFFPTHAYFCSLVSNDSLNWLAGMLLILVTLSLATAPGEKVKTLSFLIAFILAFAMLVKSSSFVYYPVVGYGFAYRAWRERSLKPLLWGAAAVGFSLACAAPWYLRNYRLYGSIFAIDVGFGPPGEYLRTVADCIQYCTSTVRLFWFPMQHVPPGDEGARILNHIGPFLALVFAAIAVIDRIALLRRKAFAYEEQILWLTMILALAAYTRLNLNWLNTEGRFLFIALPSIIACMTASPARLFGKSRRGYAFGLAVLGALYGYSYFFVL